MALPILMPLLLSFSFLILPLLLIIRSHQTDSRSKCNLPPGPRPLPIIGNLHQLGPLLHRSLYHLSKLHGPILHLYFGRIPVVVVSSPALAEQVFKTHDLTFGSRPPLTPLRAYSFNASDFAFAPYGDQWRKLRKIFVMELASSIRIATYRSIREEENEKTMQSIKARAKTKSTINISEYALCLSNSILCRVAFGSSKAEGVYGERSKFHSLFQEATSLLGSFFVADYLPRFGWIVDELMGKMRRMRKNTRELNEFYQEVINEHLKDEKSKEGSEGEDIVDVLIGQWKQGQLTMDNIKGLLMNILLGGSESSAETVAWAMTELVRNPVVMKKAQDEVRKVIGNKGKVEEGDLPQLHYLKLVVNETLRLHTPGPITLPRETVQHCQLNGYDIPAKTILLVNLWAIGRDVDAWENPEEFNPDRFIGSTVGYVGNYFHFLPFGGGRRICPGLNFAVPVIELELANFLYIFNWDLPPGMKKEDIDMTETNGIVVYKKIPLCLVPTINEESNVNSGKL